MKLKAITLGAVILIGVSVPSAASVTNPHWKTTSKQTVELDKWTTLKWAQGTAMPTSKKRALYSTQVRIDCTGKKRPQYVKIRLRRVTPSGYDTTATNTWVWGTKALKVLYASHMWQIKATYPVQAQIRIVGGNCTTVSERQFKMWTP